MQPVGSLSGHVTSGGQTVARANVIANPQQAARGSFTVTADTDGSYKFDKLAPDTYLVSATRPGRQRGAMQSKTVTISPAQANATLDIDLPADGVAVTVHVGGAAANAQVFLMTGLVQATLAEQVFQDYALNGDGSFHQAVILAAKPATMQNVEPGAYTLCGVPYPSSVQSAADMLKLRSQGVQLPAACVPQTINENVPAQDIVIALPAPPGN